MMRRPVAVPVIEGVTRMNTLMPLHVNADTQTSVGQFRSIGSVNQLFTGEDLAGKQIN